jgi:hypothetical protein
MTAGAVGEKLGRSRREVLHSAHDLDLPVRPGGNDIPPARAVQVLSSLYADPLVRRTLRRHRVPVVTTAGLSPMPTRTIVLAQEGHAIEIASAIAAGRDKGC